MNLVELAERIISEGKTQVLDCYGETVAMLDKNSVFYVRQRYTLGKFYGWNICYIAPDGQEEVMENYDDEKQANQIIEMLKERVKNGEQYFMLPSN